MKDVHLPIIILQEGIWSTKLPHEGYIGVGLSDYKNLLCAACNSIFGFLVQFSLKWIFATSKEISTALQYLLRYC